MAPRQTSLLIEAPPLQVIPQLAKAIGLNEAIVLQQIHYWLLRSENERDGRKWVYKSTPEWAEEFPFWSEATIKRTVASLKAKGLILITKKSATSWERVNWYTVDYEGLARIGSNCTDASAQSDPKHGVNTTRSIGSKSTDRSGQPDPVTLTTETTSENTTEKRASRRPGEDYVPSESIKAWAKERGFMPYLDLHVEQFRDCCTTQQRKPYTERGLEAAFRKCIREDWGDVRKKAQLAAKFGGPSGAVLPAVPSAGAVEKRCCWPKRSAPDRCEATTELTWVGGGICFCEQHLAKYASSEKTPARVSA
jgi:hypothetical protein